MVRSRRSIVGTLVLCNLRSIVRKNMNKNLFLFSSSFLFGLLFLMWCLTSGIDINFLSDEVVSKLSFDMICQPKDLTHSSLSSLSPHDATPTCQPYIPPEELNKKVHPISPTTILLHILDQKTDDSNRVDMKHFAKLLGSIMMNGLPLLGLDDFVHASDFVNRNLDTKTQQEIIQSPLLNGQFGNFLNVRNLQIRLSPTNCWTLAFVKHLKKTSAIINVCHLYHIPHIPCPHLSLPLNPPVNLEQSCQHQGLQVDVSSYQTFPLLLLCLDAYRDH
jgi:hypothetical protein